MGALETCFSSISWQKLMWPLDILSEFAGVLESGKCMCYPQSFSHPEGYIFL